ncbi:hypothetical protein [Geobacillus zalihae]|uniref:hypothetical protein n=1 Tax=Geobacillus zalihae TaxID=213419 RepID=UPI0016806F40|nr:hypothetical protein [Geobacillus zalihae]QNU24368.1 hypothetical protein IC806_15355 [Geobacillus zalihae]
MGSVWEFLLVKENDQWKMQQWKNTVLEGQDLKLTKEEAKTLLSKKFGKVTFVKEYDFVKELDSKETHGKSYLFKVNDSYSEHYVVISSENTHLINNYPMELPSKNKVKNKKETLGKFNIFNEYLTKMHLGLTKEELINQFGEPNAEKVTASDTILEYADAIYTVSEATNQVYQVEIIGEKAATYYKDFEEVSKAYNIDEEYAAFLESKTKDAKGYHLIYDNNYDTKHIYTSDNKNGNPIKSILVQKLSYK